MAVAYMVRDNISEYDKNIKNEVWEYDYTLSSPANGDSVLIPVTAEKIIATLYVSPGGNGKIQTTTNKIADVKTDTNVVWVDWDSGSVDSTVQDSTLSVTAIRQINVAGTTRMMLRVI